MSCYRQPAQTTPASCRARLGAVLCVGLLLLGPHTLAAAGSGAGAQRGDAEVAAQLASGPDPTPEVRVVQDMHTARLDQMRTDREGRVLVTMAGDKTLRIWRPHDLHLLRTVYLPSGPGLEGTPYGVAVSADGRTAYAGGYTGLSWHGAAQVYVIDVGTGRLRGAIGSFPGQLVTALDLSPDGKRLSVGLSSAGLAEIDAVSGALLNTDRAYAGEVSFLHHAPDGRLASVAQDGCLRVYDAQGQLRYRNQYPEVAADRPQCTGGDLGGVRYSPDGRYLALGLHASSKRADRSPELPVFDTSTMQVLRHIQVADAGQRSLCCMAWSADSQTLYIRGDVDDAHGSRMFRVRDPLKGTPERWDVGRQQLTNMLPLPDGSLLLSTTVPSLTRIDGEGRQLAGSDGRPLVLEPIQFDFYPQQSHEPRLAASTDGSSLALRMRDGRWLRAQPTALLAPDVLRTPDRLGADLHVAEQEGRVRVQALIGIFGADAPARIAGHDIGRWTHELVWSWAGHASLPIVAVGTQWRLLLLDAQAEPVAGWSVPLLSAPAYQVVISGDGRWVIAGLGDGTVHWYERATGRERLGLFLHTNGADWVAWRPDGYYASSPGGDEFVGWLVNRGDQLSPDLYRAVQFERRLYRPDLLHRALGTAASDAALGDQVAATLRELAPPRVNLLSVLPVANADAVRVTFQVEATGHPIHEVGVYLDGIPALTVDQRGVAATERERLVRTVTLPVRSRYPDVRVEAESEEALGLDQSSAVDATAAVVAPRTGTLWILAVGVSSFDYLPQLEPLPFASNDAQDIAGSLTAHRGGLYAAVRTVVLSDRGTEVPSKRNIDKRLRELEQMKPEDTLVLFLASHGDTDGAEYYFLPRDASLTDVQLLIHAQQQHVRLGDRKLDSLLSGSELMAALRRLPGRRILALDTCHPRVDGASDPFSLIKRSASAQMAILSAAQASESSYDSARKPHGAFSLALLDAMDEPAARSAAGMTVRELFEAALPKVQAELDVLRRNARGVGGETAIRQTPALIAPKVLQDAAIIARQAGPPHREAMQGTVQSPLAHGVPDAQ